MHYTNAVMVLNVHAVMDGGATSDDANPESSVLPVKLFAADMQMLRARRVPHGHARADHRLARRACSTCRRTRCS